MWWIFQIIAIVCVTAALTFGRWYGLNYPGQGIFTPWAVKVGVEFIAAYAFIKSFTMAPSFFQPWFMGAVLLALFGFLGSLLFFGEAVSIVKILGATLAVAGSVLLVL